MLEKSGVAYLIVFLFFFLVRLLKSYTEEYTAYILQKNPQHLQTSSRYKGLAEVSPKLVADGSDVESLIKTSKPNVISSHSCVMNVTKHI